MNVSKWMSTVHFWGVTENSKSLHWHTVDTKWVLSPDVKGLVYSHKADIVLYWTGKKEYVTVYFLLHMINYNIKAFISHSDPTAAAMVASSLLECRDDRKRAEELAKENGDIGIEVMEYINAAGRVLYT